VGIAEKVFKSTGSKVKVTQWWVKKICCTRVLVNQ